MTQQTEHDPGMILPSLRAKLQRFVDELTPNERAHLCSNPADVGHDALSPSLEAKAERAAEELTPEEEALLERLAREAVAGEAPDTRGYMKPLYEGPFGWKGPPGTDPSLNQPGGGNLSGSGARFVQNLKLVFGGLGEKVEDNVHLPFL
jgi:hypothetical protein